MAGRDRISELPAGILDKILGYLPIEEAARTSVLSTVWRNIWFSLTQLNFGYDFFSYIWRKYSNSYNCISPSFYVISKVLMQHNGPIRKIVFEFPAIFSTHTSRSWLFDFDQWLLLVTRNGVEEINLGFESIPYRLPNCIFSCTTLRRLHLFGVTFEPINAPCILPNVTSLSFERVDFGSRDLLGCVAKVPMLENLSFIECENTFYCNITAPKLCSFSIACGDHDYELHAFLPVNLDLRSVRTIELNCSLQDFVKEVTRTRGLRLPVLNVEYLKLSNIYFPDGNACPALIDLLRICPELRKLDMLFWDDDVEKNILKLLEELPSVAQTHKMFRTLKLVSFNGWKTEMLFIKGILACFPALEKVIIVRHRGIVYNELKIVQELLRFPRASPKAEIIYI